MASIQELLRPKVVTKLVSQIASTDNQLIAWMGFGPEGKNQRVVGGRHGEFHVFNRVRTTGLGTAPGAPAAQRARNPVGRTTFTFPRLHESVYIGAEEIHNLSRLGFSDAQRDEAGADYIRRQMIPPAERLANWRTVMTAGMLRDSLYFETADNRWYPTFTSSSTTLQINYQMPAGNKTQMDMLGGGDLIDVSWDNASADIPKQLGNVDAAFTELYGGRLEHIWLTQATWAEVLQNDFVASGAGLANTPYEIYDREAGTKPDGTPVTLKIGKIKALPWVDWHVSDEGVELGLPGSGTYTKLIEANKAVFMGAPTSDRYEMLAGSEPIAEYDNAPMTVKIGAQSWTKTSYNPTGWEMFTLDNCLPCNYIPKSIAYGTVVF